MTRRLQSSRPPGCQRKLAATQRLCTSATAAPTALRTLCLLLRVCCPHCRFNLLPSNLLSACRSGSTARTLGHGGPRSSSSTVTGRGAPCAASIGRRRWAGALRSLRSPSPSAPPPPPLCRREHLSMCAKTGNPVPAGCSPSLLPILSPSVLGRRRPCRCAELDAVVCLLLQVIPLHCVRLP